MELTPKTHTCPDCGYIWEHGINGSHSCVLQLKNNLQKTSIYLTHLHLDCYESCSCGLDKFTDHAKLIRSTNYPS